MLRNNIAGTISQIGLGAKQNATVIDPNQGNIAQDLATAFSNYKGATDRQAYIDALNSGDQAQIDKALAAYDPQAYAKAMETRQEREWQLADADKQFERQKELADLAYGRQVALANLSNQNAIGLEQLKNALKNQTNTQSDADSLATAQKGINQLAEVARDKNLGVFTEWRRSHGLTGKDVEIDKGKIASGVAALAPRAIAKLKAAGVSGINSLPEFMTYIGLPENPTSEQIAGAIPLMAQVAGVENPMATSSDIVTPTPNSAEMQIGSTQKFNNGFSITRVK